MRFISNTYIWFNIILFVPMINILFSIYSCDDSNVNNYIDNYQCRGILYYIYFTISMLFIVVLSSFSFLGITLCYESIYQKNNYLSKQTSLPDTLLFILKLSLVILSEVIQRSIVILYFYFCFSFLLLIVFYFSYLQYPPKLRKMYNLLFTLIFWNSFSLLLNKMLSTTKPIGLILFILVSILITIIIFFSYGDEKGILFSKNIESPEQGYIIITQLIDIISKIKLNDRSAKVILDGYILNHQSNCPFNNCPLKQYNSKYLNFKENLSFLYQHIDNLYKQIIERFPSSPFIKVMYSYFLYYELNKKALAFSYLYDVERFNLSLHMNLLFID